MVKLRKGPVCRGTLGDGSSCGARVGRVGERCHVCLERLATSPDVEARRELAHEISLPVQLFEVLGADPDHEVRLSISLRDDCPLVVLQRLEHDEHSDVRTAAGTGLSTALTPRVLQERGRGNLFTRAELEELSRSDGSTNSEDPFGPPALGPSTAPRPASRSRPASLDSGQRAASDDTDRAGLPPGDRGGRARRTVATERIRRVGAATLDQQAATVSSGFDEILNRLEALGTRLGSLESVLESTGGRLGVISDRLDDLGDAAVDVTPAGPAEGMPGQQRAGDAPAVAVNASLPPEMAPAELDTGPVFRPEVVAAAWLAMIPLLARRRRPGRRLSPPTIMGEPVSGPFMHAGATAVAELPAVLPAVEVPAVVPAADVPAVAPAADAPAVVPAADVPAVVPVAGVAAELEAEEASTAMSAAVSAEVTAVVSAAVSAEVCAAVSAEVSAAVSAEVSAAVSTEVSAAVCAAVSAEVPAAVSAAVSAEVPAAVCAAVSAEVPAAVSAAMSAEVSAALTAAVSAAAMVSAAAQVPAGAPVISAASTVVATRFPGRRPPEVPGAAEAALASVLPGRADVDPPQANNAPRRRRHAIHSKRRGFSR